MRALIFVPVLTGLALIASTAAAQLSTSGAAMRSQGFDRMGRFEQQLQEHALDSQTAEVRDQNPRRVRRAQRAAEMINKGDCAGARAMADRERDAALVVRIDQVCATAVTSVTPPQPVPGQ